MQTNNTHTIAFYNLENFFDTKDDPKKNDNDYLPNGSNNWTERRYMNKLERITAALNSIENGMPLAIGVAEIENRTVLHDLLYQPAFKGNYRFVHFDSQDRRGIDVAFLYNKTHLEILDKEKIPIRMNGNSHFVTRDILYIKTKLKGEVLHFFVNHWPSRGEGILESTPKRAAAATVLYNRAMQIIKEDSTAKIIIMGDFNDLPVSKSIKSCLHAKSHRKISNTQFFNLAAKPHSKKLGSLFAKDHWLMFDQILISKGMIYGEGVKITAPRLTIHNSKELLYFDEQQQIYKPNRTYSHHHYHGGSSDHLPVYVEMSAH
jgi:endonuclease/exonuclease/phosphatase family metal-dependent hydrolase